MPARLDPGRLPAHGADFAAPVPAHVVAAGPHASGIFIGLMSGTSLDGVDAVAVRLGKSLSPPAHAPGTQASPGTPSSCAGANLEVLGHVHQPFEPTLREELLALNSPGGVDELHRACLAANGVARAYAQVVHALLQRCALQPPQVEALGAHGQTVRHRPQIAGTDGYTTQLLNGALLAEMTGIDVIADFRSRDVAASGQGAPLVPAAHAGLFGREDAAVAVLNVGGIANVTGIAARGAGAAVAPLLGFDTGPGNVLMDLWIHRVLGEPYDADGAWAASGRVDPALLARLLDEPYFDAAPPKSTGRDLFHAAWLDARLAAWGGPATSSAADVQATLAELTATTAVTAIRRWAASSALLVVAGGGARNAHLLSRMRALAAQRPEGAPTLEVITSDTLGIACDQLEAIAFAWLAQQHLLREPGNRAEVTGARGPRILGAWYPR